MKDYRVEIRVKNNYLYQKMKEAGLTAQTLADACGLGHWAINKMLNLKSVPITKTGKVSTPVSAVAHLFGCDSSELFPPQHYDRALDTNSSSGEMSLEEVGNFILENNATPELLMITEQMEKTIEDAKESRLTDRQRKVLEMRIDDKTYDEIAAELGVSRERIRQIEAKAHNKLKPFLYESAKDIGLNPKKPDAYNPTQKEIEDGWNKNRTLPPALRQ